MSYELAIAEEAEDDLAALVDSLPAARRADAIQAVEQELLKLAANPLLAPKLHLARPTYRFRFEAGSVTYHWAATFQFSDDERHIVITHVYRVAL